MSILLHVTEHEITALANHELRPLLNQLLISEAKRHGIPPSSIEITDEDNISDDGIDARIEHSVNVAEECRIPPGLSIWQYKAGSATATDIDRESRKPGVQDTLAKGGSYCFVVGQKCSDSMRRLRERALDNAFENSGKLPKRKLFAAAEIAEWVADYPVIAAQLLKFQLPDEFYTFRQWDELPQSGTRIEFQFDETRQTIVNGIARLLKSRSQATCIRLVGVSGTGKTRLVLEAIRAAEAQNLTFYAVTPEAVPDSFFSFVQARTSINQLVLVVDECSDEDFRGLWRRAQRCNGRVILITVGSEKADRTGELEPGVFFFLLDELDNETVRRIVHSAAPSLQPELQLYITRIIEGNVKLAIALAESLSFDHDIDTVSKLMTSPQIRLSSLVRNDEERDAMYALSLLRFVGLDDDVSEEGKALADFLNIDFGKLKRISYQMERRGLVIKRGRFRYVTPSLLAVWFAKDVWEAQGNDLIRDLMPRLPSISANNRLLQRLGDIGEERFAIPIVEEYFCPGGQLASVDALDNEEVAKLFGTLANAAPVACTQVLERIFQDVSHERLLEFTTGRRQIIYALERLLRFRGTFYQAARILLKLAAAENETWGNNASGIWQEIFYTHLGLSPFPAWERHSLIEEAVSTSNRIELRLLGMRGLLSSLTHAQFSTYGEGPGGHFPERWHPEVSEDVWRTYGSALGLLDRLLTDADERVAQEAVSTLIWSARVLLKSPLKNEVLDRLEKQVCSPQIESQKKSLVDVLDQVLEYEAAILSTDEIARIRVWRENLLGNSYHDRLRRWVGELNWTDRNKVYVDKKDPIDLRHILADLAQEGHQNPAVIRPELPWLISPDAQLSGQIAFELGILDEQHFWLNELLPYLPAASHFISGYLLGCCSKGNRHWVEGLLDNWVQDHPELSETAFLTIRNLEGSDKQAHRIIDLVRKGWLEPEYLDSLWMGKWLDSLSEETFNELLKLLTERNEPKYTAIALHLIIYWTKTHTAHGSETAQFVVSLLERVPYDRAVHHGHSTGWYHWQQVCMFYLRAYTANVVEAVTHLMRDWANAPMGPEDDRVVVLREALKISPELAWPVIGKALLESEQEGFHWPSTRLDLGDRESLDTGSLFEMVESSILVKWIEENKPTAPRVLAQYIHVEQTPLPDLARELIINYGDDKIVRGRLHPQARSMSWWGSYAERLQKMLDVVRSWLSDEHEAVRRWATEIAQDLERTVQREKPREDEQDLFWR